MASEVKLKVKFVIDYEVRDFRAGTDKAEKYREEKVYNLPERSAMHFVGRGLANIVDK